MRNCSVFESIDPSALKRLTFAELEIADAGLYATSITRLFDGEEYDVDRDYIHKRGQYPQRLLARVRERCEMPKSCTWWSRADGKIVILQWVFDPAGTP